MVVALGSNLGDPPAVLREAMAALHKLAQSDFVAASLWQSTPVDCPPGSPLFVNAVVAFTPWPDETPETLLDRLQALEQEFGRWPKVVLNEPRPLDLDLIAFGSETRSTPRLTLPHPRARLRHFVLEPLNEIAPDLILPGQAKFVRELLAALRTDESLRRL
ncbi:MAG: 2-amino-4-hydroxy-6-hydroxymethyldihydropteridine diphosphokinase [Verrucomicrobia bacterium]|nr:2-amino-4-hydroxy-6-hydroxymethyldihydropteridine diphosphokinase [Verrucomicrobiota bacterium]